MEYGAGLMRKRKHSLEPGWGQGALETRVGEAARSRGGPPPPAVLPPWWNWPEARGKARLPFSWHGGQGVSAGRRDTQPGSGVPLTSPQLSSRLPPSARGARGHFAPGQGQAGATQLHVGSGPWFRPDRWRQTRAASCHKPLFWFCLCGFCREGECFLRGEKEES